MNETTVREVRTPALEIAYEESGPAEGPPVVLLHGFPDDVRAYDGVAPPLAAAGWRVLVPTCAAMGRPGFSTRGRRDRVNKRHSAMTSRIFSTRSASSARHSRATIGAAAPPASSPHYGRNASPLSSRSAATTFRTSPNRASPRHPIANTGCGTSGISTLSVAEPVWRRTGGL